MKTLEGDVAGNAARKALRENGHQAGLQRPKRCDFTFTPTSLVALVPWSRTTVSSSSE